MKNITFINAGAGSGKTYRLTQELNKAIISGECKAHEVLLTTFTKKAAEEIKVKSRENLLKDRLLSEANDLQNAYIGTVHSVGQQIIQKFWHYIGFPKEINVINQDDVKFYFNQAISEIPSTNELKLLNEINYRFNPMKTDPFGYNEDKWKEDLIEIINLARTNKIDDFTESEIESVEKANALFLPSKKKIDQKLTVAAINSILSFAKNANPKNIKTTILDPAEELKSADINNLKYSELLKLKKITAKMVEKEIADAVVVEADEHLEFISRFGDVLEDIKTYNSLLFKIAKRSLESFDEYKKELGLIDYSDMENGFLRLLDIEEVKSEIKETVKLVMVDEFQDSSPIQLAIFIKLSKIVNRSIWVGDPKQSIYGFRGTDPILIEAVIKRFESKKDSTLTIDNLPNSYRSRPEIVECVNKIFKAALKNHIKEDRIELIPNRTDEGFNATSALHHFNFVEEGRLSDSLYHKSVAKGVVKILNDKWPAKGGNYIRAKDIAILCKSHKTIKGITEELNLLGVQVSAESEGLEKTAEYLLIVNLIKLIKTDQNTLAKAEIRVLTEEGLSISNLIDERLEFLTDLPIKPIRPNDQELNKSVLAQLTKDYTIANEEYYRKLNSWGKSNFLIDNILKVINELKELPVPQLIEQLINRLNIYSIVSKWGSSEQRQSNLQKLVHYAYNYDERCINMNMGASITGFIYYLQTQKELTESKSTSDNSVNAISYHGSKGLEWPMVILTDFQKETEPRFLSKEIFGINIKSKSEINLDEILKERLITIVPWIFGASNTTVSDEFQNTIKSWDKYEEAKIKSNNELKRLLYVGMTRPRDYLITTGMSRKKKYHWIDLVNEHNNWKFEEAADVDSGKVDIFDRGINFQVHKLELSDDDKIETKEVNQYFAGKEVNAERHSEPYFISPSKVDSDGNVQVSVYADIQNRIPVGSSAKDKVDILGNCLHDSMYLYIGNRLNNNTDNSLKNVKNIISNHQMDAVIDGNEILSSIDILYNYLIKEFSPIEWHRELPLECEIDGQLYKGEADLVLQTSEGYVLIDYKSYHGDMERVLDAASLNTDKSNYVGKYAGQLNTYKKMIEKITNKKVLKKLIYYTVLGKLVELS
jgi:ATP-dependent exoDNAse (exonuclease V) beta subunit